MSISTQLGLMILEIIHESDRRAYDISRELGKVSEEHDEVMDAFNNPNVAAEPAEIELIDLIIASVSSRRNMDRNNGISAEDTAKNIVTDIESKLLKWKTKYPMGK